VRSVQQYLVSVAVLLVLLICTAAALVIYQVDRFGRAQAEQQLLATTRALSLVVDGEHKRYQAILDVLSTSASVEREDWDEFDRRARRVLPGPQAWVVVADRAGRQLVNTRLRRGATLPEGVVPPAVWAELDRNGKRICDLAQGRIERRILCVDRGLMREGRAAYLISVVMRPDALGSVVGTQAQGGSFATIIDRRGVVVWRNVAAGRFVGKPATADLRAALARSDRGVMESRSLEGVPTVAAFSRSALSGWTFVVAVPRANMRAGTGKALATATVIAALLLIIGALVGLVAARRVTRAVKSLAETTAQIERGEQPSYRRSGLLEVDTAGNALQEALRARRVSEERYRRIFEQTSDLILAADLNQIITDANPSAAAAVGLSREEAVGRSISDFVSPEDFQQTTQALRQKLTTGGTTRYDVRVRSSGGDWLFWEIASGLTYDREGKPVELHVVGRDITERKRAEDRQRLLVNELNHRVKNTLAVVQSIAQQTLRNAPTASAALEALEGRLAALSAAHDILTRESWGSAALDEIARNAVQPFCDEGRCTINGPSVRLNPRTAVAMALAFHELATNATKYGALSDQNGKVTIGWTNAGGRFSLEWREENGPAVSPPIRRGFGSRMMERGIAAELGGRAELSFERTGLVFRISSLTPSPE
jgi:PAS domain S-box-containing protein